MIYLKVQDSLLECIKTYEKTEQFVYEYMCIIHEKAAALPGTVVVSRCIVVCLSPRLVNTSTVYLTCLM